MLFSAVDHLGYVLIDRSLLSFGSVFFKFFKFFLFVLRSV